MQHIVLTLFWELVDNQLWMCSRTWPWGHPLWTDLQNGFLPTWRHCLQDKMLELNCLWTTQELWNCLFCHHFDCVDLKALTVHFARKVFRESGKSLLLLSNNVISLYNTVYTLSYWKIGTILARAISLSHFSTIVRFLCWCAVGVVLAVSLDTIWTQLSNETYWTLRSLGDRCQETGKLKTVRTSVDSVVCLTCQLIYVWSFPSKQACFYHRVIVSLSCIRNWRR